MDGRNRRGHMRTAQMMVDMAPTFPCSRPPGRRYFDTFPDAAQSGTAIQPRTTAKAGTMPRYRHGDGAAARRDSFTPVEARIVQ